MIDIHYKLTLRDKRDGYVRTTEEHCTYSDHLFDGYDDPVGEAIHLLHFDWEENNNSCDCNRSIQLYQEDENKWLECNTDENLIELVELEVLNATHNP